MATSAETITTRPCTGSGWVSLRTASKAKPSAKTSVSTCPASDRSARECETTPPASSTTRMTQVRASAFFSVAPWSVTRSMNSSYPPPNALEPPIFAALQVGQEHPVAEPFVADLKQRQAVPVQEEEQRLHPGAHRLDAVGRQAHLHGHLCGPAAVEAALAGEQVGGGQDAEIGRAH